MNEQELAEDLRQVFAGPMSEDEVMFLRDIQGFIDFAIRNGLSFRGAMAYLSHDWNEYARFGFDFKAAKARGFMPRVTGFFGVTSDAVGAPEE